MFPLLNSYRFQVQNQPKIGPNTSPDEPWWLRGAICLAMRAPGEPLGAVGGSSGPRWGLKGAHIKSFEESGGHREPAKAPKEPPRSPQEHPKRAQESPQTLIKSIFRSQTLIFPKSSSRQSEIKVFEGRRVSFRAQNRYQEARREET